MTAHDPYRSDRILDYIARATSERGYPPTVRDIMRAVGLRSTSAVQHHLDALERDGLITRDSSTARSVRVSPFESGACPTCGRVA